MDDDVKRNDNIEEEFFHPEAVIFYRKPDPEITSGCANLVKSLDERGDFYHIRMEDIENFLSHLTDGNEIFRYTKRMNHALSGFLSEGLSSRSPFYGYMSLDEKAKALEDRVYEFLDSQMVKKYVSINQPYTYPIPQAVIKGVQDAFELSGGLSTFVPLTVYRASNYDDDSDLYMVIGRSKNPGGAGNGNSYSCWTSYNATTGSLNYGHYGLESEKACRDVLKQYFNDGTEEPEKYGFGASKYDFPKESEDQSIKNNILRFERRRGR